MNCLILGGGGFLGSHLSEGLATKGHRVCVFERPGYSRRSLDVIEGNIDDPPQIARALSGMDVVFHLACTTVPGSSNADPIYDLASNVLPTLRVLEAARQSRVARIVFFSSGGTVYGIPERMPIDEDHPTNPTSAYGIHKLAIEKYLALYRRLYGLDSLILRISNAFGEGQSPTSGQGVVAAFLYKALRHEPVEIWGDGSVVRDYIHVSEIVSAAIKSIEYEGHHRTFNIGSGIGISLRDVVVAVEELVGVRLEVHHGAARPFDVPISILDISRAKEHLNWSPQMSFRQGLQRTLRHLDQPHTPGGSC